MTPKESNSKSSKLSGWGRQLLVVGLFWASLTGMFLGMPDKSLMKLAIAVLIVGLYAAGICWFRRRMMWGIIGVTVMINIILNFIYPGEPIVYYIIAMTLSVNFLLFGELGIQLLKIMNRPQTFLRLVGCFAGALSLGWLFGAIFGHTPA